jgi:hypothetical protein
MLRAPPICLPRLGECPALHPRRAQSSTRSSGLRDDDSAVARAAAMIHSLRWQNFERRCCSSQSASPPDRQDATACRLSDIEDRFVCKECGKRGADISPDFHWDKPGLSVFWTSITGFLSSRTWDHPFVTPDVTPEEHCFNVEISLSTKYLI